MISHDLKCIFIHIPRCAGTSVEQWLVGQDYWGVDSSRKHLIASQARSAYREYWEEYFKFAIVRNPFDRILSCLKYQSYFGLEVDSEGNISFDNYHQRFGEDAIIEFDWRFHTRQDLQGLQARRGFIYGNILDEGLDFIAHFETLQADMDFVRDRLGVATSFSHHAEKSPRNRKRTLSEKDVAHIRDLYQGDFALFGYDITPDLPARPLRPTREKGLRAAPEASAGTAKKTAKDSLLAAEPSAIEADLRAKLAVVEADRQAKQEMLEEVRSICEDRLALIKRLHEECAARLKLIDQLKERLSAFERQSTA